MAGRHRKHRAPLNAAQRQPVEDAWICVQFVLRDATERFGDTGADFHGEIAERLCCLAPTFDASKSSLRTWATNQARYAVADAMRNVLPAGFRRGKVVPPRTMSIYSDTNYIHQDCENRTDPLRINAAAPETRMPLDDQDAIDHVTRGLLPDERSAIVGTIVHGRRLKDVGEDFGLGESRMSQVRAAAIERLRQTRTVNQEGEITCRRAQ